MIILEEVSLDVIGPLPDDGEGNKCNTRAAPEGLARGQKKMMGMHAHLPPAWYDVLRRRVGETESTLKGQGLSSPGWPEWPWGL